jgi:hypothetical protein
MVRLMYPRSSEERGDEISTASISASGSGRSRYAGLIAHGEGAIIRAASNKE